MTTSSGRKHAGTGPASDQPPGAPEPTFAERARTLVSLGRGGHLRPPVCVARGAERRCVPGFDEVKNFAASRDVRPPRRIPLRYLMTNLQWHLFRHSLSPPLTHLLLPLR